MRISREHAAALLGLESDASPEQVNRAWRVWAKLAHPDAGGDRGHFEALAQARAVLLDAVRSKDEPTPAPTSSFVARVPVRDVLRRPGRDAWIGLALVFTACLALVLSASFVPDPFMPDLMVALAIGAVAGGAAWLLNRGLLLPVADTGHRICVLSVCWFPVAAALTVIAAFQGVAVVAYLPIIVAPFVMTVALINPGAGLWRPSRSQA